MSIARLTIIANATAGGYSIFAALVCEIVMTYIFSHRYLGGLSKAVSGPAAARLLKQRYQLTGRSPYRQEKISKGFAH